MSKYKLTYFNIPGRGEVTRWLFVLADVPFEDYRVDKEEWQKLKPTTPFKQLPILEVDGTVLFQSAAFNRFLAKRFGFGGKTEIEQVWVDIYCDCVADFFSPSAAIYKTQDPAKKAELTKIYLEEQLPYYLGKFEEFLEGNKTGSGYLVGDGITLADLSLVRRLVRVKELHTEVDMAKYPRCAALVDTLLKHPNLVAWHAKGHPQ